MTFTYNGIGTRYVGNKNQVERTGDCAWCHKTTRMSSYDTRLWFVVFFVPVVPLQKLRILDQCARCTRHRKVGYAQWLTIQEEARNKAGSLVQARRDDPAAAIEAHRTLLGVDLTMDAAALAQVMASRFDNSALVHVYLADLSSLAGRPSDAHVGYARAHAIDPNDSAAREGLAHSELRNGELERALELLKPVIAARTARNPIACRALADTLTRVQRYTEAHAILMSMLDLFPTLSGDKTFRKQLRACEKKLGVQGTKLSSGFKPKRQVILVATLLILALVGVVWADRHAAAHLALHVVDSADGSLMVDIPDMGSVEFDRPGRRTLEASAGTYTAHVTGAVKRDVQFTIEPSRWPTFLDDAVFVLDASGGSVMSVESRIYTRAGKTRSPQPKLFALHDFNRWSHVDFAFEPFPDEIELRSANDPGTRMGIEFVGGTIDAAVWEMLATGQARQAFDVAQTRLKIEPDSAALLQAYVTAAQRAHVDKVAEKWIEPRLQARPIDMPAHMGWVLLRSRPGGWKAAAERYDELMASEPDETAWPLLRALVTSSASRRIELLKRAVVDDRHGWFAWSQLAQAEASAGDWAATLDAARHALSYDAEDDATQALLYDALAALGRDQELEVLLEQALDENPCDTEALLRRAELMALRMDEAQMAVAFLVREKNAARACPDEFAGTKQVLGLVESWTRREYGDVVKQVNASRQVSLNTWVMCARAEQGSMTELLPWLDRLDGLNLEPYTALGLAVACRANGEKKQAAMWERLAIQKLPGYGGGREAAFLLQGRRVGVADEALDLDLPPSDKAVVLALLSFSDKKSRAALLTQALTLLPRHVFPRDTIERLATNAIKR